MTPLLLGARRGHANVVQVLVQRGADMDVPNAQGLTALHFATHRGYKTVVQELLAYGSRVKARDDHDDIPLHFASAEGHIEIMQMLLKKKSPVNAQTNLGNTPLHLASLKGRTEAVKLLMQHKAELLENTDGHTPLKVAQDNGHHDIVDLLSGYAGAPAPVAEPTNLTEQPETAPYSSQPSNYQENKIAPMDLSNIPEFVVRPPPKDTVVPCFVIREKTDKGILYSLFVGDKDNREGSTFLLSAIKRKDSKTGNYPITLNQSKIKRGDKEYIGKLRANLARSEYTVYDDGDNPARQSKPIRDTAKLRKELATVVYSEKYPREISVLVPTRDGSGSLHPWQPTNSASSMMFEHHKRQQTNNMVELRSRHPTWSSEIRGYVLDFYGRVTAKSSKNFMLIKADEAEESANTIMLFGRVDRDVFNLDYQYPLSAVQAFGVALTAFDTI